MMIMLIMKITLMFDGNDCYDDNNDGNNDKLMGVCPSPYLLLISTFSLMIVVRGIDGFLSLITKTTTMIFAQNDYSQC